MSCSVSPVSVSPGSTGSGSPGSGGGGVSGSNSSEIQWCFSQVKGTLDDDVTEQDIISCVEFNQDGDLLATGDKGGRVVIFQRDPTVRKKKMWTKKQIAPFQSSHPRASRQSDNSFTTTELLCFDYIRNFDDIFLAWHEIPKFRILRFVLATDNVRYFSPLSLVQECEPSAGRIQRLQYLSESRARVWLPQEFRNRRKNQQNQMAQKKKSSTFLAVNKRWGRTNHYRSIRFKSSSLFI